MYLRQFSRISALFHLTLSNQSLVGLMKTISFFTLILYLIILLTSLLVFINFSADSLVFFFQLCAHIICK